MEEKTIQGLRPAGFHFPLHHAKRSAWKLLTVPWTRSPHPAMATKVSAHHYLLPRLPSGSISPAKKSMFLAQQAFA